MLTTCLRAGVLPGTFRWQAIRLFCQTSDGGGAPSLPFGTRGDVECTIGAAAPFEKNW